jgi:hypothetical protein
MYVIRRNHLVLCNGGDLTLQTHESSHSLGGHDLNPEDGPELDPPLPPRIRRSRPRCARSLEHGANAPVGSSRWPVTICSIPTSPGSAKDTTMAE